ncbi:MAG TPA: hypothetical protein VJ571_07985 [Candidatus Nitrosotalea sp.]|nr:hypothetical protein [Candidatus Nitrosotalea sp.]
MGNELEKKLEKILKRLDNLENQVFGKTEKTTAKTSSKQYEGLTGGIQKLIDSGFFKKPVLVTEVNEELNRENYFYSIQSVDTIMRRDLVKRKKILNRVKIDGVWQYVLRK